jgi:hypothetical protein
MSRQPSEPFDLIATRWLAEHPLCSRDGCANPAVVVLRVSSVGPKIHGEPRGFCEPHATPWATEPAGKGPVVAGRYYDKFMHRGIIP